MPRRKSSAASEPATPKKRRGRPPKSATPAASTEQAAPEAAEVPEVDGRRIPVSPATARAERAAKRTEDILRAERATLASARKAADEARNRAKQSGARADATAAKKARLKVDRTVVRIAKARDKNKSATARVAELKANDRLKARLAHIEYRLKNHQEEAAERVETKLGKAVGNFTKVERAKLERIESRKAKVFEAKMKKHREKFEREHEKTIGALQQSPQPQPQPKKTPKKKAANSHVAERNARIYEEYVRGDKLKDIAQRQGWTDPARVGACVAAHCKAQGIERPRRRKPSK